MNEKKEKFKCLRYLLWIVVTGFLTVVICQIMNGGNLISLGYIKLILGALVVVILMFLAELITLCPRISIAFGLIATGLISTSNYFVYRFRGIEFVPTDMLTIVTAANVAGHYTFSVTIPFIICWVVLLGIVILSFVFLPKIKRKHKAVRRLADLVLIVVIAVGIFVVAGKNDILVQHFADHGTNENGYILNFYLALKDVFPSKPEGYSYKNVDEVAEKISDSKDMGKRPTVIAILDESFSDFSIISENFKTDQEMLPFYHSLSENTIKGYALSSVYGGNTANTEYEVLTANSMNSLPFGEMPFQMYVKEGAYSMVTDLKAKGYKTVAMHPYIESGYNRREAYNHFGFDEQYFDEDFPNEDFVRAYISDSEMFKFIEDYYENEKGDEPLFIWGVTMQNHGGYDYEGDNFESSVSLEGYQGEYADAEQYLTLIQESDQALQELIEYFEKVDEDVVILVFGDHMPGLDFDFYKETYGSDFESADEQMLLYQIPFFVWANYDIEESEVEITGFNQLSGYLYEAAGFELTPYQKYVASLQEEIPAMNGLYYYSNSKQAFIRYEEAEGREQAVIGEYRQLQYNNIFDSKHKNDKLFPSEN